ncbi:glycoside hydrolase family 16 protein [Pseudonocardia sp. GCM10023141]|uniref:glycoside hydrolase family 16 protein n=1 Tax=Pseudonocardia sp. GCM10023141 TaxID=3252653 RepID=UPI003608FDE7
MVRGLTAARFVGVALVACAVVTGCSVAPPAVPVPTVRSPPAAAAPTTTAGPVAVGPSKCSTTAAARYGWGTATRESDFQNGLPADWHPYGPEPGHERRGLRTPAAITVADGIATITGTKDGTTGAMSWHPGQKYGRWEACVKSDAGRGGLNAVILLWPVAEDWPVGGEIDWMEIMEPSRQETGFHLHFGANNDQDAGSVTHDATQWTAWALEWTPQKITGYIDGKQWYSSTDPRTFPPRPMVMTMQLDYFGDAPAGTAMHMDWARQWALPESQPATLSLAPGDPATGQPQLFPNHVPRKLG